MKLIFGLIAFLGLGATLAGAQTSATYAAIGQQWVDEYNAEMLLLGKTPSASDETYQGAEASTVSGWTDYYSTSETGNKYVILHVPNTDGPVQLMFTGDSITQWLPWLTQFPQNSWANMAASGSPCVDLAARFKADLATVQPKIAIIACGTVDSYQNYVGGDSNNVHRSLDPISQMVGDARAAGVIPIVATAPPVSSAHPVLARYIRPLNAALRLRGYYLWERWFPLVEGTAGYGVPAYYESDGIHPLVGAGPDVMVGGNLRWWVSYFLKTP